MLVTTEVAGDVAVLTLNRPDKRNALSVDLVRELDAAVRAELDRGVVRALLITGAGPAFSAGADLGENKVGGNFFDVFFNLITTLRGCPLPVVAYANGPAIGAGMMLSMACDLRVGATEAYYSVPVADMAIGVNEWVVSTLASLVGASRARAMLIAGTTLRAAEAVECGYCLPGDRACALELAQTAADKAPLTVRNIKAEFAPDLFTVAERKAAMDAPFASSDVIEALEARRERRKPVFTSQ